MKKRMLSILLCLCMVLMLCPVTAFADVPPNTPKGDIDFDGNVTIRDAIQLQIYLEGLRNFTDEELAVADFNEDGTVDLSDWTALQSYLGLQDITVVNGKATACGTEISKAAKGTRVTLTANSPFDDMVFDKWIVNEGDVTLADASSATTTFTMPDDDVSVTATYKLLSTSETGSLAITVDGFQVGNTPEDITLSFESTIPGVTFGEDDVKLAVWNKYDDESDQWEGIVSEAFQADTRYQIVLYLNDKGLSALPAVTINGKTPEFCQFDPDYSEIQMDCELGTPAPAPTITINGPDVVCAEANYLFTATASEGVAFDAWYGLGYGIDDYYCGNTLNQKADGTAWGLVQTRYYTADSFKLTVSGTTADETPVSATKTVQVSQEHIFDENGRCGCGAVKTYTVTYDPGEYGTGSIPSGVKTHGEDFTLSSDTFTREGYVQYGWFDSVWGNTYSLGGTYSTDADVTLYPMWDKIESMTVPFTTTVTLGGSAAPGETVFALELVDASGKPLSNDAVTVSASVTTDGAGSYPSALTLTGPEIQLQFLIIDAGGGFVRQVDDGEAGWTVDDTVWGLTLGQEESDNTESGIAYYLVIRPVTVSDGKYVCDWNENPVEQMAFTNVYTHTHRYSQYHNDTEHWDECDCGDVQNKESHSFTQKFDETEHWKECACGAEQNREEHRYGDWTVTREATQTEEGQRERICAVCGYKQTETIPVLPHTHAYTQKHDATDHWEECGCGDIRNKELHQYGDWKVTKEATQTAKGEKEHTCTVCGYTEKAEIAKLTAADTTDSTKANAGTGATTSPKTGDNSQMAMWIALLFMGGAAVIGTTVYGKKKSAR